MVQYRISGQKTPNDLRIHAIPLGPGRRARLGVHWVTGVWTPMMSGGRPLPPGEYTVEFRNPETGLSGTLAYRAQAGRRVLHEIRRIRKDGIGPVDPQDLRSISFTAIESELQLVLDDHREEAGDDAFRELFGELATSPARMPGSGHTLTEADLLAVAVKYSRLGGAKGLYTQLADQCGGISESRARDLVRRARQEGLLESTVRGRANHALTEKARQLVRDHHREES